MPVPIQYTELDFNTIVERIESIIKEHPEYNTMFEDFTTSNVGKMFIELFAYIAENLATRVDWVANENWIQTATQKDSIVRILKILGYNFTLPISSKVLITIDHGTNFPGPYYLTRPYSAQDGTLTPFFLQVTTETGENKIFEALYFDDVIKKYDYKSGIEIVNSLENINFYEGKTIIDNFEINTENGPSFRLNRSPVIQDSVIVYLVTSENNMNVETELLKVNTFLDTEAQLNTNTVTGRTNPVPYLLNVEENDTVRIEFGTTAILPSTTRRLQIGDRIKVFYRIGGGRSGNIVSQKINTSKSFTVTPINTLNSVIVAPSFINILSGAGGKNGEDPEVAAINAPKEIRAVKKAVTPQDYEILFLNEGTILSAKAFGSANQPNNVKEIYNKFINPLDAWIYIIPDNIGRVGLSPRKYNDFEWMSFNNQNRFNEIYSFNSGEYNFHLTKSNNDIIKSRSINSITRKNFITLNLPDSLISYLSSNNSFKLKVSNSIDNIQHFDSIKNTIVNDEINIPSGDTTIKNNINASILSYIDLSRGVNLLSNNLIRLNIDRMGDTTINISSLAINPERVRVEEISAAINQGLSFLGTSYGSVNGLTGVSSIIEEDGKEFIKLTSPKTGDSSYIDILPPAGDTATVLIFGDSFNTGDTRTAYGYKQLTYLSNEQQLLYEIGDLSLNNNTDFYIHYLTGDTKTINFGNYYTNNFTAMDIEYRNLGKRIYNTVYKDGDTTYTNIDFDSSVFNLKFTKEKTNAHSLESIENFWNINYAKAPILTSITNTENINLLSNSIYNLNINIDNKGSNNIDITGNQGASSSYTITNIINNINTSLQTSYASQGDTYSSFNYATTNEENQIIINSPTHTETSSIIILNTNNSAASTLFGLNNSSSHTFRTTGDYYLRYNSTTDAMQMTKLPNSNIPDLDFYIHYIWDRRTDDTLEDNYQKFLEDKKIIGINNVFKQVFFKTFDISGEVFYDESASVSSVKDAVEKAILNEFSLLDENDRIKGETGKSIAKSRLLNVISNTADVVSVNLNYFGEDSQDPSTNNDQSIKAEFDEVVVISENVLDSSNNIIHGINLEYTKTSVS